MHRCIGWVSVFAASWVLAVSAPDAERVTADSRDARFAATGFYSGLVTLRDLHTGAEKRIAAGTGAVWMLALAGDRYLLIGRRAGMAVYDLAAGGVVVERPEPLMGAAPRSLLYFTASFGPQQPAVLFYRTPGGSPDFVWSQTAPRTVTHSVFSPDLRYAVLELLPASARDDRDLLAPREDHRKAREPEQHLLDLAARSEVREFLEAHIADRGAFTPTGDAYEVSSAGKRLRFDLTSHRWHER